MDRNRSPISMTGFKRNGYQRPRSSPYVPVSPPSRIQIESTLASGTKTRLMPMNSTIEKLGRKLRIAAAGGGEGAVIGNVHRTAMAFDGHFEIVAGALSSNPEKSRKYG